MCVGEVGAGAVDGTEPWLGATALLCYLEYEACPFWSHLERAIMQPEFPVQWPLHQSTHGCDPRQSDLF